MSSFWSYLSVTVLMITGVLMVFIILLQRGRGGGLAGAFGGAGGQSALGTKAGDVFTRITIGLAVVWVFFACVSIYALRAGTEGRTAGLGNAATTEQLEPSEAPAGEGDAASGAAAGTGTPSGEEPKASSDESAGDPAPSGDAATPQPPASGGGTTGGTP